MLSRRPTTTLREAVRGTTGDRLGDAYGSPIVNVGHADLRRAELVEAELSDTKLYNVRFERAVLHRANLKRADLSRARLQRADLRDTKLIGTKLTGANLSGADLGGARLRDADLTEADLRAAMLEGAEDLEDATLTGARADRATKWPPEFSPGDHGVEIDDERGDAAPSPEAVEVGG